MSSIPSTGYSLHSVASSIVSVAAQRSQRIIFFHRAQSVPATGRDQLVVKEAEVSRCSLGVFHSDGAGNVNDCGAE